MRLPTLLCAAFVAIWNAKKVEEEEDLCACSRGGERKANLLRGGATVPIHATCISRESRVGQAQLLRFRAHRHHGRSLCSFRLLRLVRMALPTRGRVIIDTTAGEIDIELWSKVRYRNLADMTCLKCSVGNTQNMS